MLNYLSNLTGRDRSERYDAHLAFFLTFIAGAANAGGYMAFRQYTSHMTGIASAAADAIALGNIQAAFIGALAISAFILGAAVSAVLINWGRRKGLFSQYASPLLLEAILISCFGLIGDQLQSVHGSIVPLTVILLCFIMGLQNAMITKLSGARIRTTHITGMVTDVGIELGKLAYINRPVRDQHPVKADRGKILLLSGLILMFFVGGVTGAVGFNQYGYPSAFFLAAVLVAMTVIPITNDVIKSGRK